MLTDLQASYLTFIAATLDDTVATERHSYSANLRAARDSEAVREVLHAILNLPKAIEIEYEAAA